MRKYFTILLLLVFIINTGLAQNTDSLRRLLYSKQNQEKVSVLLALSKAYWYSQRDTALLYASEALQLSKSISYARGIAEAWRHLGVINMYASKSAIAESFLDTALLLYQNLKDTTGLAATYNNIGALLQRDLGRYDESIVAFEKALFLFQKLGNDEGMGSVLNYLGLAYQQQGDYQKTIEYLLQGAEMRKKIGDIQGTMFSLLRIGDIYYYLGQTEIAVKYYMQALHLGNEKTMYALSDTYGSLAKSYMDLKQYAVAKKYIDLAMKAKMDVEWYHLLLGRYYAETGFPEKALIVYKEIMTRTQKSADYPVWATSALEISKIYQGKKDYTAAIKYAKDTYKIAGRRNIGWLIAGAANSLSFLYATQGDYRNGYKYEKIYRSISDSASRMDSKLKLGFLESKNEILEKKSSIELLNKENLIKQQQLQKESLTKKILIGGLAALALLGTIIFRNITLKRKNEKNRHELAENELQIQKLESERTKAELQQQATELEMQALRAQMNPHFIFNCLSSINRFILKNEPELASDYLTKFSRLIRMVLNNSKNSLIILEDELEMLRLYLDLERLRFKNSFDYKISFLNSFDVAFIFIPPLLLQPFTENAIWHGLMNKEGQGLLEIDFELQNNILYCYITDNGVGRKKAEELKSRSAEKQKSMGMQITANRLALLNKDVEQTSFTIEDLADAEGRATGTRITLKISYKETIEEFT